MSLISLGRTPVLCVKTLLLSIGIVCLLSGCGTLSPVPDSEAPTSPFGFRLDQTHLILDASKPPVGTNLSNPYLNYYSLIADDQREEVQYFTGVVETEVSELRSHVFVPPKPVGTIFMLHGYFDHAASLSHMINAALTRGYTVFTYDLPGHGMSSGNRGEIGGINNNADLLNEIVGKYGRYLPQPTHVVGFSTGGTIALEHARVIEDSPFDKTVLVSPLLHHTYWRLGNITYTLLRPFLSRLRTRARKNSFDVEYLEFAKQDPLRNSYVSFQFLNDIYSWNRRFYHLSNFNSKMLVVQGESDTVVDWRYNLPLLKRKVNGLQIRTISTAKHQLFNEVERKREEVFKQIFDYLDSK